jgi:acetyl-CoA carboxylase biotin carboxyl carrier protein
MIDLKFVQALLDLLNSSDADTIEIRKWTTTIKVSKAGGGGPTAYQVAAPAPGAPAPAESGAPAAAGDEPEREYTEIKSPMVGTFYAQPEPGADPYVRVGSRVSPNKILCIIEAMKIMNPLESEVSGVITKVLVEDAQPVEFGQVLYLVDPNG